MLDHADARDRVVLAGAELAVVRNPELDQVLHPDRPRPLLCEPHLRGRQRHPKHVRAVPPGGVDREASPAAADVEHALSLAEAELPADQLELGLLGLLERLGAAREVRAAVGHRLVQEKGEELVADVVVVAHRPAVARHGVALAAQPQLGGRRLGRRDQSAGANDPGGEPELAAYRQRRRLVGVDDSQRRVEVVDLQQPRDVSAAESKLAGRPEDVGQRAR